MARAKPVPVQGRSMPEVLGAGGNLFAAGLTDVFPWVLAAESLQLLPYGMSTGILDTDLSLLLNPVFLIKALLFGAVQALLYAVAVMRLAGLAGGPVGSTVWPALRAVPAVFIGYIAYMLVVMLGLGLGMLLFAAGLMFLGPMAGLLLSLAALGPTAAFSTALAFFIYPAVLERRGPFASLNESGRLARGSWVRASLVVSVPALALLVAWLAGNGVELSRSLSAVLNQMQNLPEDISVDQLQALLSGTASQGQAAVSWGWKVLGVLADAFAWWYTLAVCYAEYRALKEQDSAAAKGKKNH